jgi:hypothetical protein
MGTKISDEPTATIFSTLKMEAAGSSEMLLAIYQAS